jgi:hypothetical protein
MKDKIATILSAGPAIEKIVVNEDTNKDCLLAISLLLGAIDIVDDSGTDGIIIERQDSVTDTELNNPKLIKIGIGCKDNAALRCFDIPNVDSANASSVVVQMLKYFDLYDVAVAHYPWVEYYHMNYTSGQKDYAVRQCLLVRPSSKSQYIDFGVNLSKRLSPNLTAPIENFLLSSFFQDATFTELEIKVLTGIGRSMIEELASVEQVGNILERCDIYYIGEDENRIKVFDSSDVITAEQNSTSYVNEWLNNSDDYDVSVVVSNDTRGDGLSFFRRNDNPSIDFSKLQRHPGVIYASAEGRLVKTSDKIDKDRRKELIERAMT